MAPIQKIRELLHTPKKVVIVIHQSPDGDALGSGIAVTSFLKKKGHHVTFISPDTPPPFLDISLPYWGKMNCKSWFAL